MPPTLVFTPFTPSFPHLDIRRCAQPGRQQPRAARPEAVPTEVEKLEARRCGESRREQVRAPLRQPTPV
eukprot:362812-Chlamydomonas_euryale.AAC.1